VGLVDVDGASCTQAAEEIRAAGGKAAALRLMSPTARHCSMRQAGSRNPMADSMP